MGFKINKLSKITNSLDEIEKQHSKIDSVRSSLDYDIDGLVFKINNLNFQKRLGSTSNSPRWLLLTSFQPKKR